MRVLNHKVNGLGKKWRRAASIWFVASVLASLQPVLAGSPAVTNAPQPSAVLEAYQKAKDLSQKEPSSVEAAWQFGRACFDLAELATNDTARADPAEEGIASCKRAVAMATNSAPAHYYLGLNLGQLARTKSLGALKLVGQMEQEWTIARQLNERFDYAGPDRNLGLLYRDAPSLISVGSKSAARKHLERAVSLAPEYPENRLNLIESELQWGYRAEALSGLNALGTAWPAARSRFSGVTWAATWSDWQKRMQEVKKKLER